MLEDHSDSKPTANADYYPTDSNIRKTDTDISRITDVNGSSDVNSLLLSAFNIMNLMGGHLEAKDAVAADLMVLSQR